MSDYYPCSPSKITKHIPEDLWFIIFDKLPIKTLIFLQCVCKSWKSLLSSRDFVKHHFNSTTTKTTKQPPFLRVHDNFIRLHDEFMMNNKASFVLHQCDDAIENVDLLSLQSHHLVTSFEVTHGVVCFVYTLSRDPNSPQFVAFWNPIVRKYVSKPLPFDPKHDNRPNIIGFGFDSFKNDFKVVWCSSKRKYYKVYSSREGKWGKNIKLPLYVDSLTLKSQSCFVNGTIHWLTSTNLRSSNGKTLENTKHEESGGIGRPHGLLMFDCEHDEFKTMDLPEEVWDMFGYPRMFVYRNLLSVMTSREGHADWTIDYELWTMKEYGVTSTWTKEDIVGFDDWRIDYYYEHIDVHKIGKYAYVFEESMLLMDIGQTSSG